MSAQQALRAAVVRLTAAGVPQAAQDARRLLAEALSIGADRLAPQPRLDQGIEFCGGHSG